MCISEKKVRGSGTVAGLRLSGQLVSPSFGTATGVWLVMQRIVLDHSTTSSSGCFPGAQQDLRTPWSQRKLSEQCMMGYGHVPASSSSGSQTQIAQPFTSCFR